MLYQPVKRSAIARPSKQVAASLKGQSIGNPQSVIWVNKTNKIAVCWFRKIKMSACQLYPITTHIYYLPQHNTSAAGKDQHPSEH
jgi:hypothetical protein